MFWYVDNINKTGTLGICPCIPVRLSMSNGLHQITSDFVSFSFQSDRIPQNFYVIFCAEWIPIELSSRDDMFLFPRRLITRDIDFGHYYFE